MIWAADHGAAASPHVACTTFPHPTPIASHGSSGMPAPQRAIQTLEVPSAARDRVMDTYAVPMPTHPFHKIFDRAHFDLILTGRRGAEKVVDEEWWRRTSSSSPPRIFCDILFVGGQEAVCAVAIEPPPPIPRARMRSFDLSDAFAHPSAGDSRASRVARGRGGRAPRVQDRSGPWVDQGRRALAGLRPRLRRRGRLESNRLHVLNPRRLTLWGVGSGVSVSPPCVAGVARATTCTARAADVFPAGAWPPSSSASAVVSSSRACTRALDTVRTASSLHPNTPLAPNLTPIASSFGRWLCQVTLTGVCDRCFSTGDF